MCKKGENNMSFMKKVTIAGFVVLLAACASDDKITLETPQDVGVCQFDNGAPGAAMWICRGSNSPW